MRVQGSSDRHGLRRTLIAAACVLLAGATVGPAIGPSVLDPSSPITPPPRGLDTRSVAIRPNLPASRLPLPVPGPTAVPAAPVAGEIHLNAISMSWAECHRSSGFLRRHVPRNWSTVGPSDGTTVEAFGST